MRKPEAGELLYDRRDGATGVVLATTLIIGLLAVVAVVALAEGSEDMRVFAALLTLGVIVLIIPTGLLGLVTAHDSFRVYSKGIILPTSNIYRLFKPPRFIPYEFIEKVEPAYQARVAGGDSFAYSVYQIKIDYREPKHNQPKQQVMSFPKEQMYLELITWLRYGFFTNGRRLFPHAPVISAEEWEEARRYFEIRNKKRPFPRWWQMAGWKFFLLVNFGLCFTKLMLRGLKLLGEQWLPTPVLALISLGSLLIALSVNRIQQFAYARKSDYVTRMLRMREHLAHADQSSRPAR